MKANTNSPNTALLVPPPSTNASASKLADMDIRGIKEPVPIFSATGWLIAATILVLALAAFWCVRRRNKATSAPAILIPPHRRAMDRLRAALELIDRPKEFTIAVSDILRHYLEEQLALKAPERTTEEFLQELQRTSTVLTLNQRAVLEEFLSRSDLVKFARYEPTRPELEALHASAVQFVEQTEPGPQPVPAPTEERSQNS